MNTYRVTHPDGTVEHFTSAEDGATHAIVVPDSTGAWSVSASGDEQTMKRWIIDAVREYGSACVLPIQWVRRR